MDKNKSCFLNNCYEYLFTEDERAPIGYIPTFFMVIIISVAVGVFVIPIISSLMK